MVREAHLEAHNIARLRFKFLGNAAGNRARGNAARLRVPDPPRLTAAGHEADFRKLRGFARTRFAADDDHLILFNCADDLRRPLGNRQSRHESKRRNGGPAFKKAELLPPARAPVRLSFRAVRLPFLRTEALARRGPVSGTRLGPPCGRALLLVGRTPALRRGAFPTRRIRTHRLRRLPDDGSVLIFRSLPDFRVLPVFCRIAPLRLAESSARSGGRIGEHGAEGALRRRKPLRLLRRLRLWRRRRGRLPDRSRGGLKKRLCRRLLYGLRDRFRGELLPGDAGALTAPFLKARGLLGRTLFSFLSARFLERLIHICAHLLKGRKKSTVVRHENPEKIEGSPKVFFGKECCIIEMTESRRMIPRRTRPGGNRVD